MADPAVGLVLMVGLFGGYHLRFDSRLAEAEERTADDLRKLSDWHRVPLVVHSCYAGDQPSSHQILRGGGIAVLASLDHAARAVTALHNRGTRLATAARRSTLRLPTPSMKLSEPTGLLEEPAARRLIERAGVNLGPWRFVTSLEQAVRAVTDYGGPCALKAVSPSVVHKSEVGGVRLNVTAESAATAWAAIHDSVTNHVPAAEIHGLLIAPMAGAGVELLVGAKRDPIFGPVVAFGTGGFLVEAIRDVTFRAAPFTMLEALEMIDDARAGQLLDGYRVLPEVNRQALAELLIRVGDFAATTPQLVELDLNPVIASGDQLVPVDVRIMLDAATQKPTATPTHLPLSPHPERDADADPTR